MKLRKTLPASNWRSHLVPAWLTSKLPLICCCCVLWLCLAFTPAQAHRSSIGGGAGLPIPSLTHGQMAVIADNRADILALADRQPFPEDEVFYRLRNYISLQYLYCGWGLVPNSITDEASPFNECSHAYLSATQALLLHMRGMKGNQSQVQALIKKIELQMLLHNASLVLCRFSDEPFNTADVISPRWLEIPFHLPSLLVSLALGIIVFGSIGALIRFLLTPAPVPAEDQQGLL